MLIASAASGAELTDLIANQTMQIVGAVLFGLAIIHTFMAARFNVLAHKYPEGSIPENIFHFLGEVEVVFGLWAGVLIIVILSMFDMAHAIDFLENKVDYTEPAFVFVVMAMAATRPIIQSANGGIQATSRLLPMGESRAFFICALIIGPLLGSFITEPAAMTVTALILKKRFYDRGMSRKLMYATLGILFVNVSIGGTLSHFAAPPVVMVSQSWDFGFTYMIGAYGWKSALAVIINTVAVSVMFKGELKDFDKKTDTESTGTEKPPAPIWLIALHALFIAGVVVTNHHMVAFMALFLFFLGIVAVTDEYQTPVALKESLLVGFFLAGLVTLGQFQGWWLMDVFTIGEEGVFLGATGLTAITDNAALTYLGTVADTQACLSGAGYIPPEIKWALVGGAVAGGDLR